MQFDKFKVRLVRCLLETSPQHRTQTRRQVAQTTAQTNTPRRESRARVEQTKANTQRHAASFEQSTGRVQAAATTLEQHNAQLQQSGAQSTTQRPDRIHPAQTTTAAFTTATTTTTAAISTVKRQKSKCFDRLPVQSFRC